MMALTIGLFLGLFPSTLGSFEHDIVLDAMFGEPLDKRAATLKSLTDADLPLQIAMKQVGFSDEEIADAVSLKAEEQARTDANLAAQARVGN